MDRMKLLAVLTFALAGCASNPSVTTQAPALKLDYQTPVSTPHNGKTIAIKSFQFLTNNAAQTGQADSLSFSIKLAGRSLPFSAVTRYQENYEAPLQKAVQSSLAQLLASRGFTATGPFKTVDEIPYSDKKGLYLVMLPRLNLNIEQRTISTDCVHSVCTETGVFTLSGDILLRFVEPLSEQTLLTKASDLNGLHIRKNYVHQYPQETHKAVLHGMASNDSKAAALIDDADKELVNAINEFYQHTMATMDSLISADELLAQQAELEKIRGFKRR